MANKKSKKIIYNYPLNNRIRYFLKVYALMSKVNKLLKKPSPDALDVENALMVIGQLHQPFLNHDIKFEILQEVNSLQMSGQKLPKKLIELKEIISQNTERYNQTISKFLIFHTIGPRINVPGGLCSFDVPMYTYWLESQSPSMCMQSIQNYFKSILPILECLDILFNIFRSNGRGESCKATDGLFHHKIPFGTKYRFFSVLVDDALPCYPEITAGYQLINIRFVEIIRNKTQTYCQPVEFEISLNH